MPDKTSAIFLGNEVIIISVDDARKLVAALLVGSVEKARELQRLGVLGIVTGLQSAVMRHDLGDENA